MVAGCPPEPWGRTELSGIVVVAISFIVPCSFRSKLFELKAYKLSAAGVRGIWLRHGLETKKKHLKALEAKMTKEGYILTESQLQALEEAQQEKEAYGEIETEHPGYLGG